MFYWNFNERADGCVPSHSTRNLRLTTRLHPRVPQGCFMVDAEALRQARTGVPTGAFHA